VLLPRKKSFHQKGEDADLTARSLSTGATASSKICSTTSSQNLCHALC